MHASKITDAISVRGQVHADEVQEIADAGYRTILCNRPDGEIEGQPDAAEIRAAAEAAGLAFHHNPLTPGQLAPGHVEEQGKILSEAQGPVLAYCGSGRRASILWALSNPEGLSAEERIEKAAAAGHDLSEIRGRL
ncbi:TIGR01244 family sulfur transferase [Qipengyuania sphaerica]|uniref:TIGR01244 family sulfur transferase n=1 Tax=Qipengyuania sphaerica TaxID=2867243 RepID=UPI001C88C126|nr:TIGR01244 family sulfur transferase [Qipengyuania sphaerica]MBX7539674.1 TIGR01244 family phosphatase [Qipengyuania sphaerica]